jgi:3-dehydroquinate synthase
MPTSRTITVDLGERSYPIIIGSGLLGGDFELTPTVRGEDCLVVSNSTVAPLYRDALVACLHGKRVESINLPDGEAHKTLDSVTLILDALVAMGANRDTTVVALGGGVVGDIAGFAAACYQRGVAYIQVPTTLLAQVDSSVGGKTGVNHPIGAFHQPDIVLVDTQTLNTLPEREFAAGLAEVIKYGAIVDSDFFAWLEANLEALIARDESALSHAIARCCELKALVVGEDEREQGRRAILNFGHTFGHAIEHCQGYGEWLHGEAVAAGMVMAAELSDLDVETVRRIRELLGRAGLPVAPPSIGAADLLDAMSRDKKVTAKTLRFVLLREIGDAFVTSDYDKAVLRRLCEAAG